MTKTLYVTSVLIAGIALAGCSSTNQSSQEANTVPANGRCGADSVQSLLGEIATPELLEQARKQSGAQVARVLRPSDVVTLEYNSQRLNISTDESFKIQRINCG